MAVAFEGFSIREYVSKMRTVDMVKSWPFGGESDEIRKESVEAFLPPITVTKFRWWSEELGLVPLDEKRPMIFGESSKSGDVEVALVEKSDFVCTAAEKGNEAKSHVKMKAKSRAPKKRSIVDIFAVAPQVERVDEEDEDEGGSSGEDDVHNSKVLALCDVSSDFKITEKMKKNKKKKKKKKKKSRLKDEIICNLKKQKRMSKVKNKNKGPNKGKDSAVQLVKSIAKKEKPRKLNLQSRIGFTSKLNSSLCGEGSANDILDAVSIRKKKPTVKCLATQKKKLVKTSKSVKDQKSAFQVRKILNNRKKEVSAEPSTLCISQIDSQLNQYGIPPPGRHIRCSDMSDILAIPAASTKDHETERGKNLAIPEVNESDEEDVSTSTKYETEVQPSSTRKSLDIHNFLKPPMGHQEHLSGGYVAVNQVAPGNENFRTSKHGYRNASHDPSYDCSPRFLSMLKEGYNPSADTQVGADILKATNYTSDRLIESHSRDFTRTAACYMDVNSFSRPSSSYIAMNGNENGKLPFPPHNQTVNYPNHAVQYPSYCHFSPKELMRSICSFPDWKQRAAVGEGECVDQGFFGLPLNSQGELIQLHSSGTVTGPSGFDLSNFEERNNIGGAPTKDQLNVFPVWEDLEPMKSTHHGHKQYNHIQNLIGEGKGFQQGTPNTVAMHVTQPTMRLMGKEFTVGRSIQDLQAFDDGKVWTDKQIITERCPSNAAIGSSLLESPFLCSRKLKENVPYLSEFRIYQASQSELQMKPPASRFSHPFPTHGNHVSSLHPYIPSSASPPLFSPAPLFHDPFSVGYESTKSNMRIPTFASTPQGYMSHMTSKSADLQNGQKLPHATKSAVEFSFVRPDCGGHVHPAWVQNHSTTLPPWLLSATQQKEASIGSFHSDSSVGGRNHPSIVYGSNFQPYPYNPAFSDSTVKNSLGPPLMPLCREFIPIASVSKFNGQRMKFKESVSVKEPRQATKTRKRPAAKSSYSPKPTKILNLTVEEESSAETILKSSMAALELDSFRDNASSTKCGETEIQPTDGIGKSGPIRLSAGAKHILKPSSDTNHDNFRPTVSSIPFVAASSSGRVYESEKKSAQIYRF